MLDPQTTIIDTVRSLLRRRSADEEKLSLDADLWDDLGLDSLEVAELSATLEDKLGRDPYSAGSDSAHHPRGSGVLRDVTF